MLAELAALVLFAAPPVRFDEQEFKLDKTELVVRVDSPWPKALNKGWLPIFVRLENGDDEERHVSIRCSSCTIPRARSSRRSLA